jgi:hypothetical protein
VDGLVMPRNLVDAVELEGRQPTRARRHPRRSGPGRVRRRPTPLRRRKSRKNYAGTSPITKASGTNKNVLARHAKNDRLADALQRWAFGSLRGSPGARAYYDALRARKIGHQAAQRQLTNRHVGILHGCLKTRTLYNENTAWAHQSMAAA